jgi:hypothetical protein
VYFFSFEGRFFIRRSRRQPNGFFDVIVGFFLSSSDLLQGRSTVPPPLRSFVNDAEEIPQKEREGIQIKGTFGSVEGMK